MPSKLLIVDDEPDMLRLLTMIIKEKTSHEVTSTNNPMEALDIFKCNKFDLLITDLKMPGLDGLDLLKAVRAIDQSIPVIMITAYAASGAADEALINVAFDFIIKPFRKEQVLFSIERALKWAEMEKENKMLRAQVQS
ncbi:response regulator [Candidatus Magnetomonas plexicatena]|uniref:response regulator n=1 Tax=Candidatus Magnetomonas plexicatena TaxID=2552947 RepID=UPI001C795425|nr:response regulator [Nitrospirales bacterium LBB_01]